MFENGHLSEEEIALYADASLSGKLGAIDTKIKNHVRDCNECAEKVLAVTEITEDFLEDEKKEPIKIVSFKKNYWIQIAASVIFIFGAGLIVQQIRQTDNSLKHYSEVIDSTITQTDSTNSVKPEKEEVIAQNEKDSTISVEQEDGNNSINENLLAYTEDTDMEKLVERFTEAGLRGYFSVDIESTIEIKLNEELIFEWDNKNEEVLILEFFNNSSKKLFEEETTENIFKTQDLKNPGLYYWKLLNEDFDLLFCGKIIVR
jgi:hypothetical protein